jgi:diguanylate cyclase (GGDEF)-like protein
MFCENNSYQKKISIKKIVSLVVGFATVVAIDRIDFSMHSDLSLFILYFIPIIAVTLYAGKWAGLILSILSVLLFSFNHFPHYPISSPQSWNLISDIILLFALFFILTRYLKERELQKQDILTKIGNRKRFVELINFEINRSTRYRHPFTIVYIEIDNFKNVNQVLGHLGADSLLIAVANTIQKNIRNSDSVTRTGDHEFAILFPETNNEVFVQIINKIKSLLLELDVVKSNAWDVSFSIGCVTFLKAPATIDEMINKVNSVIDSIQSSGKNSICFETVE